MIYLVLTVLIITSFFIIFKLFARYQVNTLVAVVINYGICVVTGLLLLGFNRVYQLSIDLDNIWYYATGLGFFFITGFSLMAYSSQRIGMALSTLSSKLAMIIPIVISLLLWDRDKVFDIYDYISLVATIVAIYFITVPRKGDVKLSKMHLLLLLGVFISSGGVDGILTYANTIYQHPDFSQVFPIYAFFMAAIMGSLFLLSKPQKERKSINKATIVGGVGLGVINYFSLVVLLRTLSAFNNEASLIFPYINLSVIIASTLIGVFVFSEQLDNRKKIGVIIAILAILLLSV